MSEIHKIKLSDAVPQVASEPPAEGQPGKPVPDHATAAKQAQEAQEAKDASDNQGSTRDRMVDIGRGNQQSGRQGQ